MFTPHQTIPLPSPTVSCITNTRQGMWTGPEPPEVWETRVRQHQSYPAWHRHHSFIPENSLEFLILLPGAGANLVTPPPLLWPYLWALAFQFCPSLYGQSRGTSVKSSLWLPPIPSLLLSPLLSPSCSPHGPLSASPTFATQKIDWMH